MASPKAKENQPPLPSLVPRTLACWPKVPLTVAQGRNDPAIMTEPATTDTTGQPPRRGTATGADGGGSASSRAGVATTERGVRGRVSASQPSPFQRRSTACS